MGVGPRPVDSVKILWCIGKKLTIVQGPGPKGPNGAQEPKGAQRDPGPKGGPRDPNGTQWDPGPKGLGPKPGLGRPDRDQGAGRL